METDPKWKRGERAAILFIGPLCGILGVLCAALGAYFAAGTYLGWDKQAAAPVAKEDDAVGMAMMLPPWLGFALLGVAILSLLTSWAIIFIRRRSKKQSAPSQVFVPLHGMISINEVEFNTDRLGQAAPWLEIYLTCFNATGHPIRPLVASGRLLVSGQEFHGHLELADSNSVRSYGAATFFRFGLKVPVSATEARYCHQALASGHLFVDFPRVNIEFQIQILNAPAATLYVDLPNRVHLNSDGRTQPYLPWVTRG
jgi:hypothetical protein